MVIRYLKQHWQGDRTQGTAFWVNVVSLLILLKFSIAILSITSLIQNPVLSTRFWLVIIAFVIFVVLPWSFVGSIRSTWKHIHLFHDKAAGIWLLVALAVTLAYTTVQFKHYLPGLTNMVDIALKQESESYRVMNQGDQLYISGFLTYGSAKTIKKILNENDDIISVELNLLGGHLYEARQLSVYLAQNRYNTHVENKCELNCLIVFLGGSQRSAADTAEFSFHHSRGYLNGYRSDWTITREQEKDRLYFAKRGVYQKATYMLYYKQSKDIDLNLTNNLLTEFNIVNVGQPS